MANRDNPTKSNQLAKAALENPAISDFRKGSRSFGVIAKGFTTNDTEDVCGALMFDFIAGTLDSTQVAGLLACVDRALEAEDHVIRREEMSLKIELRKKAFERLEDRKKVLGAMPARVS